MSSYLEKISETILIKSYIIICFSSFVFCYLIIIGASYLFNKNLRKDELAIQSAHNGFVPRMGGLAIYFSILIFTIILNTGFLSGKVLPSLYVGPMVYLLLTTLPVFLIGLAEDLGFFMSSKNRFIVIAVSNLLVIMVCGTWVSRVGIPGIDLVLSIAVMGIVFTIFATTGVVNAFNLIDGINGLTSFVAISCGVALSVLAYKTNNIEMMRFLFILVASTSGFFFLNFPFGKIFLGDAGAYTLGHILVWCAILLVDFSEKISPFAILLIFFWPVADTLLAIWRRWRLSKPADRPDRLHFHQLVMRFLEIRYLGRDKRNIANPLATIAIIPMILIPQFLGVFFWDNLPATVYSVLLIALFFAFTYFVGISTAKKTRGIHISSNR